VAEGYHKNDFLSIYLSTKKVEKDMLVCSVKHFDLSQKSGIL
jgi:hypothetical protein